MIHIHIRYTIITGAGVAFINGVKATRTLLRGTTEIHSDMAFRRFQKPGDYNRAKDDFDSVRPTHIRDLPRGVCKHILSMHSVTPVLLFNR